MGFSVFIPTPEKPAEWRHAIEAAIHNLAEPPAPLTGAVGLSLSLYVKARTKRPTGNAFTETTTPRAWPTTNYPVLSIGAWAIGALEDAFLIYDSCQVVALNVSKEFTAGRAGLHIRVESL